MTPAERLQFLRDEIRRHDRLYYVEARPEIGDADYDALYNELEALEREHPDWVTPDSPTQRVGGAPLSAFKQVRHTPPMMSLDKTHSRGDLTDFDTFLRRQLPDEVWDYVVEPKIDGVAFSLLYEKGRLTRAATRGNGEVGDDITANIKTIRSIPLTLPDDAPELFEARGEVYMTRAGFAELNRREEEAGREPFMNPRNAAAGSLKQLDPREVARRPLDAVIYATGAIKGAAFPTHSGLLEQLKQWSFKTPPWKKLCVDIQDVLAAIDELESMRHDFPFEIDGAVVKVNRRDLYAALGSTAKSPRWARAFKYEPERAETRIWKITVQVGRTGVLTPVAELDPVLLAGSEISRATLHNADEIRRKDIRVGDRVWVVKAGDVIPAIESVITEKRDGTEIAFAMPGACPECGGPVVRIDGEVAHRCTNPACPAQRVCRLEHFASRSALDIRGLGGKVAELLVTSQLVTDPLDLFSLTEKQLKPIFLKDATVDKESKAAKTMLDSIQHTRDLPLDRWLFATGIPGIGATVSEQVAAAHGRFSELARSSILEKSLRLAELSASVRKSDPEFERVCGEIAVLGEDLAAKGVATRKPGTTMPPEYICTIKPEAARALIAFFNSDYGKAYTARLAELGIDPQAKERPASSADATLTGETFVLTGTLSQPRTVFAERIKAAGGIVQDAVTKNTRYLVAGANVGATKLNKARSLGTTVLDEAGLLALLSGTAAPRNQPPSTKPPSPPIPYQQPELF